MRTKSRSGKKTDAKNESVPLRGVAAVCAVWFGGAGSDHQANRFRAAALRPALLCLLHRGTDRVRLADAAGARVDESDQPCAKSWFIAARTGFGWSSVRA